MTEPYHADNNVTLHHGDCLDRLRDMPDNSVDAIVTDPPYGLSNTTPDKVADTIVRWASGEREHVPAGRGFMGRPWDAFVPPPAVWDECLRVLKPGGHMAVFAGSRTQDLMGMSIRLAGFELRDSLAWIYGSGFSKGGLLKNRKGIDWCSCAENAVNGAACPRCGGMSKEFEGVGPCLKPAQEPIILARRPLDGTVAGNVLAHGVGGLNIDACRVGISDEDRAVVDSRSGVSEKRNSMFGVGQRVEDGVWKSAPSGRFPANVLLDEHAAKEMDRQSGWQKDGVTVRRNIPAEGKDANPNGIYGSHVRPAAPDFSYGGGGGASRFFPVFKYQAKAPKRERPVIEREDGTKVSHPTVKPLALMEWLVTLITPPGGVVLDPFAGSGTTLEAARGKGFRAVGVEADAEHCELIVARLAKGDGGLFAA